MDSNYDVVFVIARFLPYKGGAEQNCFQLARQATIAGKKVLVLTTDVSPDRSELPEREEIDGIEVRRVHAWNSQLNLGFYPALLGALLNVDAPTIHVCNGAGFIWRDLCLTLRKIWKPDTRILITPHGPFVATLETHSGLKRAMAKVAKLTAKPYFYLWWRHLFSNVIAVNSQQHAWLTRDFGFDRRKIILVPNGIPASTIIPSVEVKTNDDVLDVVYLGRWEKYKRIQDAILALKLALEQKPQTKLKLHILGKGIYEQKLRELVAEKGLEGNVNFIVHPDDTLRDNILLESDIILLASDWEATGIVLLEGMAKGCVPITSTGNEASREILVDGESGVIYETGDIEALSSSLLDLADNPQKLAQMQKAAWQKAHQFTWEEISKQYLEIL